MAYWLLKTEPETFSWDDQVKRGAKGEPWTGVRNFIARGNLKEMKKGDHAFFYHTGEEKQVVGIVEVVRSDRRERRVSRRRRQGGKALPQAGDACRGQSRRAPQGNGAREISASVGAAGNGAAMEDRLRAGRREGLTGSTKRQRTTDAHPIRAARRRKAQILCPRFRSSSIMRARISLPIDCPNRWPSTMLSCVIAGSFCTNFWPVGRR